MSFKLILFMVERRLLSRFPLPQEKPVYFDVKIPRSFFFGKIIILSWCAKELKFNWIPKERLQFFFNKSYKYL